MNKTFIFVLSKRNSNKSLFYKIALLNQYHAFCVLLSLFSYRPAGWVFQNIVVKFMNLLTFWLANFGLFICPTHVPLQHRKCKYILFNPNIVCLQLNGNYSPGIDEWRNSGKLKLANSISCVAILTQHFTQSVCACTVLQHNTIFTFN